MNAEVVRQVVRELHLDAEGGDKKKKTDAGSVFEIAASQGAAVGIKRSGMQEDVGAGAVVG